MRGSVSVLAVLACGACGSSPGLRADANVDAASATDVALDAGGDGPVGDGAAMSDGPATADGGSGGAYLCGAGTNVLNVVAVRVYGNVTLNGGPIPSNVADGARIWFGTGNGISADAPLATSSTASYDVVLAPGRYDVHAALNQSIACLSEQCPFGLVARGVDIQTDGRLDLDLAWAPPPAPLDVQGTVTFNGATPTLGIPSDPMSVTFQNEGGVYNVTSDDGTTSFTATLPRGRYRVRVDIGGQTPTPVPCTGWWLEDVLVDETHTTLALDFKSVTVQGHLTLRGEAWPGTVPTSGGVAVASPGQSAPFCTVRPQASGDYVVELPPGQYDIGWAGSYMCNPALKLPCNGGTVRRGVELTTSTRLDFDVPAVHVRGAVTINGGQMPDDSEERGTLLIDDVARNFGKTGAASYDLTLFPGTYAVSWVPWIHFNQQPKDGFLYCRPDASLMPCNDAVIAKALDFLADGTRDFDIPVVRVQGTVTSNGRPIADAPDPVASTGQRGQLLFARPEETKAAFVGVPATGAAVYSAVLVKDRYDLFWALPRAGTIDSGSHAMSIGLPYGPGRLRSSLSLPADGRLDLDLRTTRLAGRLVLNGRTWPADAVGGYVAFAEAGAPAASMRTRAVVALTPGPQGPTFAIDMLEGTWSASYEPRRSDVTCDRPAFDTMALPPCNGEPLSCF